ncbi:hypothetical protein J7W08_09215 [Methanococcoides orientis]|uniref:hypothetical protein n=1 Tax=Methanococcoides orientis TaxID=2822137 RepID=UPI001E5B88A7|nr:hypothetical protein [Methanococcoides orientis]UGV40254.1 hypothetical protein J7W08_09215 [Methanococcoides orientis]
MSIMALERKLKLLERRINGTGKFHAFIFIEGSPEEEAAMTQIADIEEHEPNADVNVIRISRVKENQSYYS